MKHGSFTIALNTEASVENGKAWAHLVPAGRFNGIDGRGPYDATDLEGIILASRDYAGRREMVVDYNHATDRAAKNGGDAPAAGWIVGMQARDDGIWGLVDWTPAAAARLAAREYRYLSPVFTHDTGGRIGRIMRASLTNIPNLDQLTALASAEETTMDELLAKLRTLLGLQADADQATVLGAVSDRLTASHTADPDPAKYVPIGQFQRAVAEANKLRQGITQQAAEEHVDEAIRKGKVLPWMRDWSIALCTSNLPAFDDFVSGTGAAFTALHTNLLGGRRPPAGEAASVGDHLNTEIARNMGLDPKKFAEFRAAGGSSRED